MAYKIRLKINIKYMIVVNLDVQDGLVNGCIGTLKHITFDETKNKTKESNTAKILWFQFERKQTGSKQRKKYQSLAEKMYVDKNYVPIFEYQLRTDCSWQK